MQASFLSTRVTGTGWDIYWTDRQFLPVRQLKSMMPYQRINYFPGMSILTNKQNLTQRLNLYQQLFPQEYDFFPKTWVVDKHSMSTSNLRRDMKNSCELHEEIGHTKENNSENERIRQDIKDDGSSDFHENLQQSKINSSNHYQEIKKDTKENDFGLHKAMRHDPVLVKEPRNEILETKQPNDGYNTSMSNKTIQTDITVDNVLKEIINAMKPLQTHKTPEEQNCENMKQIIEIKHDEIIMNDQLTEAKCETNEENEKRTKEVDNNSKLMELGIKTKTIVLPNLRSTTASKRCSLKPVVSNIGTPRVLLKDNVKNMVEALNRLNRTVGTVNKWKNIAKEHKTSKEIDAKQSEDKLDYLVEQSSNKENVMEVKEETKVDEKQMKATKVIEHNAPAETVESKPIYILKPCDGCQGKGIKLAMNMDDIVHNMEFDAMICQQYITNPLLWNGYKFDIRFYVLITSVKHLRIYVYNEGIVRLATEKYELPDATNINNMYMHLTNYSINKNSEKFNEDLSKQSLERLNAFLRELGVDLTALYAKINDIIVKTILTGYKPILKEYIETFKNYVYREACFQLLGFDIILDNQYNPYLLEINKNASLKRPTAIDKLIKTKLTRDLFNILNLNEARFRGDILRDNLNYNSYKKYNIEHEIQNRGDFRMVYPGVEPSNYNRFIIDD